MKVLFGPDESIWIDPKNLHPDYLRVFRNLEESEVPFAVIGGVSVALYGGTRLTRDIDFIAPDVKATIAVLYRNGFYVLSHRVESEPNAWVAFADAETALRAVSAHGGFSFKSIHGESRAEMDVWIRSPNEEKIRLEDVLRRAVRMRIGNKTCPEIPVASRSDVIELKEIALAEDPSRAQDEVDIRFPKAQSKDLGCDAPAPKPSDETEKARKKTTARRRRERGRGRER